MTDVFLSYSRQELSFAESLYHDLSDQMDVWFDIHNLEVGIPWQPQIDSALAQAETLLLLVSKESIRSEAVIHEWRSIYYSNRRVVLLIIEAVELPPGLSTCEWVDFRDHYGDSLRKLNHLLSQAPAKPATPVPQTGTKIPFAPKLLFGLTSFLALLSFIWAICGLWIVWDSGIILQGGVGELGGSLLTLGPMYFMIYRILLLPINILRQNFFDPRYIAMLAFLPFFSAIVIVFPFWSLNIQVSDYITSIYLGDIIKPTFSNLYAAYVVFFPIFMTPLTLLCLWVFGTQSLFRWSGPSLTLSTTPPINVKITSYFRRLLLLFLFIGVVLWLVPVGFGGLSSGVILLGRTSIILTSGLVGASFGIRSLGFRYEKQPKEKENGTGALLSLDYAAQDSVAARRLEKIIRKYQTLVPIEEADTVLVLISRHKLTTKANLEQQKIIPIILENFNYTKCDPLLLARQWIDLRRGLEKRFVILAAKMLGEPKILSRQLGLYPIRINIVRPLIITSMIQVMWLMLFGLLAVGVLRFAHLELSQSETSIPPEIYEGIQHPNQHHSFYTLSDIWAIENPYGGMSHFPFDSSRKPNEYYDFAGGWTPEHFVVSAFGVANSPEKAIYPGLHNGKKVSRAWCGTFERDDLSFLEGLLNLEFFFFVYEYDTGQLILATQYNSSIDPELRTYLQYIDCSIRPISPAHKRLYQLGSLISLVILPLPIWQAEAYIQKRRKGAGFYLLLFTAICILLFPLTGSVIYPFLGVISLFIVIGFIYELAYWVTLPS